MTQPIDPAQNTTTAATQQNETKKSVLRDVDTDVFLDLLLAELQNQDPLNPLDNHEILQQVSQIREVESNLKLTETLEAVLLGQAMTTATSLVGRWIKGLADSGDQIAGYVERVNVTDGKPKLIVAGQEVDLKNVAEIYADKPQS